MKPNASPDVQRRDAAAPIGASSFLPHNFAMQSNLSTARVISVAGAGVTVGLVASEGRRLRIGLHGYGEPLIELNGLLPDRHYHTGHSAQRFLKADREGRALLRVPLNGSIVLQIEAVV